MMLLTEKEFEKLNAKDKRYYNSLSEDEKIECAISFRERGILDRQETRGRHKKNCECEKCKLKKFVQPEKTENETKEIQTEVEKNANENSEVSKENSKNSKENKLPEHEGIFGDAEKDLQEKLNAFRNSEIEIRKNEYEQKPIEHEKIKPDIDITNFISGALFLTAMDYMFPIVLKYGFGFFNRKYQRIKPSGYEKLQLSDKEKQYLEPSAEQVVKYLFADANPVLIFAVVSCSIYAGKLALLDEEDFEKPKTILKNGNEKRS